MVPVSFLRLLNYVYLSITYSLPGHKSKPLRNRFISPAAGHTRRCYKYRAVPAPPRRSPAGRVETHRESCHYGGRRGTRLRPLSLGMPKPMVPLLGRPVMEHIIGLLKRHGIDEIAVTLCYMPEAVQSYFGDGQKWGVRLHYFIEEAPLGTAGSVRACAPFLEGEDFLVISGDSVCDLDLTAAMEFHQAKRAQATPGPLPSSRAPEYGLVLTDEEQRVVPLCGEALLGAGGDRSGQHRHLSALPPGAGADPSGQALGFWKGCVPSPAGVRRRPVRRPRRRLLVRHGGLRGLSGLCGGRPLWEGEAGYGPASAVPPASGAPSPSQRVSP